MKQERKLAPKNLEERKTNFLSGTMKNFVCFFLAVKNRHRFHSPEYQAVTFGVLFFLGSGMLLLKLLDRLLCRLAPVWGITASGMLFFLTRNINDGYLGFEDWNFFKIPEQLYLNKFTTYVGFTEAGFFSSDYFSLMPWFFLYLAGYYCLRFCETLGGLPQIFDYGSGFLSFFGRRSLLVYLLHQPLLYLLLTLILGSKVLL